MASAKLSFSIMLIHWCNKLIDWFMRFFEDSDLYWTDSSENVKIKDTFTKAQKTTAKVAKKTTPFTSRVKRFFRERTFLIVILTVIIMPFFYLKHQMRIISSSLKGSIINMFD